MKNLTIPFATMVLLYLTLPVMSASAQDDFWEQTNGPEGGLVEELHRHTNGDLFLATRWSARVYRSEDNGLTWHLLPLDLADYVEFFASDDQGNLYAGIGCGVTGECSSQSGVYMSSDNGDSWTHLGLENLGVTALLVQPNGDIVAGAYGGQNVRMYRSTDAGANWNITASFVETIVDFTTTGDALYAAAFIDGLHRSTDGGASWNKIDFPCGSLCQAGWTGRPSISNLVTDSQGRIFASAEPEGIFISTDDGASWTNINNGLPTFEDGAIGTFDIAIADNDDVVLSLVGGRVFRSSDAGASWNEIGDSAFVDAYFLQDVMIGNDGVIFVTPDNRGLYRTEDNGASWTPSHTGVVASSVGTLVTTSNGDLFASAPHLVHSADNGDNWSEVDTPGSGVLAANRTDELFVIGANLYRSADGGASWETQDTPWNGFQDVWPSKSVFNANNDLFVAIFDNFRGDGNETGIYRSTDDGTTWNKLSLAAEEISALSVANDGTLYAGTGYPDNQIFLSTDNGDSWTQTGSAAFDFIMGINVDPDGTVFVNAERGLFRSTDGGVTWTNTGTNLPNSPYRNNAFVESLMVSENGDVYAGISGQGIYVSRDRGNTWTAINSGLGNVSNNSILSMAIANGRLFAGTWAAGVFRSKDTVTSAEQDNTAGVPSSYTLSQNFPNPFNPTTTIGFTVPSASEVTVTVYNVLGQPIRVLTRGVVAAGHHQVRFDGSGLASGLYFVRMQTPQGVHIRQMVMMK